jgi:tetratricopeptide (TPR) repeat protein
MASKLNKKFIAILAGALLFACVGIAAIAFFILSGDADRAYQRGIAEEKQGNLVDALSYMGRAISKDPANQSYYDDFGRILLQMVPESETEAIERYQRQYIPLMEKRISFFQNDSEAWENLVNIYLERALLFQTSGFWESVIDASDRMIEQFPQEGAPNRFAREVRLLAMAEIYDLLKFNEQDEFNTEIDTALASGNPSSIVWEIALERRLNEAIQYKSNNDKRRLAASLSEEGDGFDGLFKRFVESGEKYTPGIRNARIRRLYLMDDPPLDEVENEKALALEDFKTLANRMIESGPDGVSDDDLNQLREIFKTNILNPADSREVTLSLFTAGILPLDLQLMYATTYTTTDPESSSEVSRAIIAAPSERVGLLSMAQPMSRRDASIVLFDSIFNEYSLEQAGDGQMTVTLSDINANAQIVRDLYSGVAGSEDIDLYLDGSIALIEGDMSLARAKLAELRDSQFLQRNGVILRYMPRLILAYTSTGERGAATEALAGFLATVPLESAAPLRIGYAVELLNQGRRNEALIQLNGVLTGDPGNETALRLIAKSKRNNAALGSLVEETSSAADRSYQRIQNAVSDGRLNDALQMALALNESAQDDNTKNLVALLYFRLDRFEDANRVLDSMDNSETNLAAKQLRLLMSSDDPIERLRLSSAVVHEDVQSQKALFFSDLVRYFRSNDLLESERDALITQAFDESVADFTKNRDVRRAFFAATLSADAAGMSSYERGEISRLALEAVRALETDEVELINTEAVYATRSGDYLGAIELLEPLIQRGIASEETLMMHALALDDLGRNAEAIESMRKAFSKSPGNVFLIRKYAELLNQAGEQEKALGVLRNAVLAPLTRGLLMEQWLASEAEIGNADVALAERRAIYQSDIDDSAGQKNPIINLDNALQYAKLLLSVSPKRIYILNPNGATRFSENRWSALSAQNRRELLSECRISLRDRAFETLDDLEKNARNPVEVRSIRLARAECFKLANDDERVLSEVNRILECCDSDLTPTERLRIVSLASGFDDNTVTYDQLEKVVASEDISSMRIALEAGMATGWTGVNGLGDKIFEITELPRDKITALRMKMANGDFESIQSELDLIRASSEYADSVNLRFETLLFETEIELAAALELIRPYNDAVEAVGTSSMGGDAEVIASSREKEMLLRAQILNFYRKGIALSDDAIAVNPSDIRPYLRKHTMLQSLNELQHSDSVQADMIANAKIARDIKPMNWPANSNLIRAYMISGQGKNGLQVADQYVRRGGTDPRSRSALTQIARSEGLPGLAIPSMKIAMKANPTEAGWPRDIALLLLMAGDTKGAAEMWWNVVELDKSPEAIEAFIDLEFRQDQPNLDRLTELFKMAPGVINNRPVLLAAKALATSMAPGQRRRGERMMADAYKLAIRQIESGEESIVLDRMLVYFFMLNEDAPSLKELAERLQVLIEGPLGAHEYAGLASVAFDSNRIGGSDLVSGAEYLQRAIDLAGSDKAYMKALMQQLSTVLYGLGRCPDAIAVLTELIEMGDDQPSTLNNLAYMIIECENDPKKALGYSTRAIRNNRNIASYLDTHGYILFRVGDLDEAFRNLNRSVILQPSASNLLNLADVLAAQGKNKRALVLIEQLTRDFPNLDPVKQQRATALYEQVK